MFNWNANHNGKLYFPIGKIDFFPCEHQCFIVRNESFSSITKGPKLALLWKKVEVKGEARARGRGRGRVGRGRTVVSGEIRATVSKHVIQSLSVREAGQSST